ncbi:MAG TPA: flagellar basal-body MS-ring/collar protein FliF [Nocardioides sp.]
MRDKILGPLTKAGTSFRAFTAGQKVVAVVGTGALLVAAFMIFQWVSKPTYVPLFSNLSSADASAIVESLDKAGTTYELSNDGSTILVPAEVRDATRIAVAGDGLPTSSAGGYALLDDQGLSPSEFTEQTNYKRAMEGELAAAVKSIDGVDSATVLLALPEKEVFADEQEPATASVLVRTRPGSTLPQAKVQAVVHLVASSIEGLDPEKVTVTDAAGQVLTTGADGSGGVASNRQQLEAEYIAGIESRVQSMLNTAVGVGNATVAASTVLDFDERVTRTREYADPEGDVPAISESTQSETYEGTSPDGGTDGGVVGPDGQMDTTGDGTGDGGSYEKNAATRDNAVNVTETETTNAPGTPTGTQVSVMLDSTATTNVQPGVIKEAVAAAAGVPPEMVSVQKIEFDTSAADEAAAALDDAAAADAAAARGKLYRNLGIAAGVLLLVLIAFVQQRRKARARRDATSYVVEQLRAEQADRAAQTQAVEANAALAVLESSEKDEEAEMRQALESLVERQPEDVAALLRGWLVERGQ